MEELIKWNKYEEVKPKEEKDYLVKWKGEIYGNYYVDIAEFSNDLSHEDYYRFNGKEYDRQGFYKQYDYAPGDDSTEKSCYEITNVVYWAELPKGPKT